MAKNHISDLDIIASNNSKIMVRYFERHNVVSTFEKNLTCNAHKWERR